MIRGELWTVAGGVYASKPRPALIVQDDRFGDTDSVTVLPLTTVGVDAPLLRIPVPVDSTTGIRQDSFIMVDKLTTVRRSNVQERVGRVSSALLVDVERSLLVFLGLAG
jgi:mRNA interferase MazF